MSLLGDIAGGIGNTFGAAGNAVGDAYSNITGYGKTSATQNFSNLWPSATKAPAAVTTTPSSSLTGGGDSNIGATPNPYQSQIDALNHQTAALQAQIAAQPKLIYRDTNAAWQSAQNAAASSVNPVYQDTLNRQIQKQADLLSQQQADTTANKALSDTNLANTQQQIDVTGQRSQEDTDNAIAMNQQQEGNWQTQEGTQADTAENAARLSLGDGQGVMGRGAGALESSAIARNQASDQQTQTFANDRNTKELLNTRTMQDLTTKGNQATQLNATDKANLDRHLNDFITNQNNDMNEFKATNEASRLSALFNATQQQYSTDTANWLASLVKSGARSQDVALAGQVYK